MGFVAFPRWFLFILCHRRTAYTK